MTNALPVAFYLKDLSGDPVGRGMRGALGVGADGASEVEKRIGDAHALGVLEGRAAAQVETEKALANQAAQFERKLTAERQKWTADQGARLGDAVSKAMQDIEQGIADQVGRVLSPIVSERIRIKAVEELSLSLNAMLAKGDYAKITITGPNDLLSVIESRLNQHDGVSFVNAESVDVAVQADETIVETRIGAWAEAIEEDNS
jgi:hypothetical protein